VTVVAAGLDVEEDEEVLLVRVVEEVELLLVREDVEVVELLVRDEVELVELVELLLVRDDVEVVELLLRVVVPVEELAVLVLVLAASRWVSVRSCPALRTVTPEPAAVNSCVTRFSNESFGCWCA
jgi:hypothetical protein